MPSSYVALQIELRSEFYTKIKIRERLQALFEVAPIKTIFPTPGQKYAKEVRDHTVIDAVTGQDFRIHPLNCCKNGETYGNCELKDRRDRMDRIKPEMLKTLFLRHVIIRNNQLKEVGKEHTR